MNLHSHEKIIKPSPITAEEQSLSAKARQCGGETKLPEKDFIRLITLRHMRDVPNFGFRALGLRDAGRLAKLELLSHKVGGESRLEKKYLDELKKLKKKRGIKKV